MCLQLKFIKWPDCCLDLFILSERKSSPLARLKHLRPLHPAPSSQPVLLLSWSFWVTMRACGCHLGLVAGAGEGASGKDGPSEGTCALWRRQAALIISLRIVCFGSLLNSVINSRQIPPVSRNISIKYWLWVEKKRRQTYGKGNKRHLGSGTVWRTKITGCTSRRSCGVGGQGSGLILCLRLENKPSLGCKALRKQKHLWERDGRTLVRVPTGAVCRSGGDAVRVSSGGSLSKRKHGVTNSFCFSPDVWCEWTVGILTLKLCQINQCTEKKKKKKICLLTREEVVWCWQKVFPKLLVNFQCLFAIYMFHFQKCRAWKLGLFRACEFGYVKMKALKTPFTCKVTKLIKRLSFINS